ncbi:PKD domain-containing protein [Subsaximicrobium wynnwilliamsii]|uniref:PKD domain-containing protein n=1 Tax=Subsaximicrobium wynnwilliamsii TaxID=291179 RepID=A0A5C6ZGN4_9FLAO|nr:PKD domain-containing protein [Subsaximicrobium wynnwilliamsii]TXD82663.1 PKD domain-containing protein [Subsaximicrobium wynnwilliamsii]TXD88398.1 PKD domain-containing protein [Subsaximicrobium wynnwilliamsii]TXE02325.1 PKD domain-containing protein [Subsaximicrobium wynnwilliamsii]
MNTILKYLSLAVIFMCFACSNDDSDIIEYQQPVVDFSNEAIEGNSQLLSFTNLSENATSFQWDFGDGSDNSYEKHPSHLYNPGGAYMVTLKGFNGDKATVISKEIMVAGNPVANFSYTTDAIVLYQLNFENLSQNADSFQWDFGDGEGTSTVENPSYTYTSAGTYSVTLLVQGAGGTNSTSIDVIITEPQPSYDALYIVGDASPSGWNIGSPEAFTQSNTDAFIFTYQAVLTAGEFKISTFQGDWCDGDWLNPPNNGDDLSENSFITTSGCEGPDNKWMLTSANEGTYLITVDLSDQTIVFELQ